LLFLGITKEQVSNSTFSQMVGYGESLAKARRPGWESAYIEYGNLKSLVEEVERLYQTLEDPPINTPTASYEGEQEALLEDGLTFVDEADTLEKAAGHSELFSVLCANRWRKSVSLLYPAKVSSRMPSVL